MWSLPVRWALCAWESLRRGPWQVHVQKDSEASGFLKFNMRESASHCECDQLISGEQREASTILAQHCIKRRNSVSACGLRVIFNNVQSYQPLSLSLKIRRHCNGKKVQVGFIWAETKVNKICICRTQCVCVCENQKSLCDLILKLLLLNNAFSDFRR